MGNNFYAIYCVLIVSLKKRQQSLVFDRKTILKERYGE